VKRLVFVFFLITAIGIFSFGQISVRVNPQTLPPRAPFTVMVDSDITNVSEVVVAFNGSTYTKTSVPATFVFYAPKLPDSRTSLTTLLTITIVDKKGVKESKSITIQTSVYAKPVIAITPLIKTKKNSFKGDASFDVKVYGGVGIKEIDYFVDETPNKTWTNNNPTAILGVYDSTFTVDTSKMKNGNHLFSVGIKDVTGKVIASKSVLYTLDNVPPLVETSKVSECLPSSKKISFEVTAISTLSGIDYVEINGIKAPRTSKNSYTLDMVTPKKTGMWAILVSARDNAGNVTTKTVKVFVDDSTPELNVESNANYIERKNATLIYWKNATPLTMTIMASAASQRCCNVEFEVNGVNQQSPYFKTKFSTPGTYLINASVEDPINGLKTSTTLSFVFRVDNKAPSIENVKFYPNAFTNKEVYNVIAPTSTLTITITATDGKGSGVKSIDLSTFEATGNGDVRTFFISQLKDGENNDFPVKVKLTDKVGNSTTVTEHFKIFVDVASPTVKVEPKDGLAYGGVYWKKEPPLTLDLYSKTQSGITPYVTVKLNDKNIFQGMATSQPIEIPLYNKGKNALTVLSINPVNKKQFEFSNSYVVDFDNVSPVIEDITLPSTKGPNQQITVKVKARDDGIGLKEVKINGAVAKPIGLKEYEAILTTPDWKESGSWKISVSAQDMLGNESSASATVYIDAAAPHIDVSLFPDSHQKNGVYWSKDVPFFIQVTAKTDSGVAPSLTSLCNDAVLSQNATMISKEGLYRVTVKATNPVNGKVATVSKTYKLKFDKAPSIISDVTFAPTVGPNQKVEVKASIVDKGIGIIKYVAVNNTIMKEIGSSDIYEATIETPMYKKSAPFKMGIIAVDIFGNKSTYSTTTFVDVNPPAVKLYLKYGKEKFEVKNNDAYFFKEKPTLWYSSTTDGNVKPVTQMSMDCSNEIVKNGSEISGTHFVEVTSTNVINGKALTIKRRFSIVIDKTPPTVTIKAPEVINTISSADVNIFVNDEHLKYAFLVVKLEEGNLIYSNVFDENGQYTINLRQALNGINGKDVHITLMAKDMAGNCSFFDEKEVKVDTVPPSIKDVTANKNDVPLMITMSENVKGNPKIVLISHDGKEKLVGMGKINGNKIYVYEFNDEKKIKNNNEVYKVEIENVTDNAGNTIGNNYSEWVF
jgi:hypothetical protein